MPQDNGRADALILDLLAQDAAHPLTFEEVATMLPELSWAELFHAVDHLSRRRRIILSRHGFTYLLADLARSGQQTEVVMAGSVRDSR